MNKAFIPDKNQYIFIPIIHIILYTTIIVVFNIYVNYFLYFLFPEILNKYTKAAPLNIQFRGNIYSPGDRRVVSIALQCMHPFRHHCRQQTQSAEKAYGQ